MAVTFTSRLSAAAAPLTHAWEHTIGSGHAPLALGADWQESPWGGKNVKARNVPHTPVLA
jgi:hypothetical protein